MDFDNEIIFRIPAPSDGIETVLVLFGIAAILVAVLACFQHRETVKRIWTWVTAHPWEKSGATVNLLSWAALIFVGPVAAVLFVMALGEAYSLLQQEGGSDSRVGSLGRGAVIVALIGAPLVIWRSMVAQKTVNLQQASVTLQELGNITDRIDTAVQGLAAEKTVKASDEVEQTVANLEVRIWAIYSLERLARDSERDHLQIMDILCAYIRQNAPAPAEDDWPDLEMKESEDDGPLEADWDERLQAFREAQAEAGAKLKKPREDIQTALTVIGRRSAKQRRLEAGRGVEAPFPFDTPCPKYDGPNDCAYWEKLNTWQRPLLEYLGYRLDLRNADLRGADLSGSNLKGARLAGTHLQGSDLKKTRLEGAVLVWARLQGANFEDAHFEGADLTEAQAYGAVLSGAQFNGANLAKARMQAARLEEFFDELVHKIRRIAAVNLQGANLNDAWLQGAQMDSVSMQTAILVGARMQGAKIRKAQLQGAIVVGTRLQRADLAQAQLQGADLTGARLQGAKFMEAQLQEAKLELARMDNKTQLAGATLRGAAARFVDYTDVPHIAAHLDDMFGDASVTLPGGHGPEHRSWPPHWPRFEMDILDFHEQWRAWQADPAGYTPPERGADETA